MKLSIVIPCYNETKTIRTIVDRVRAAPVASMEIIIVDDCSTDGTREILRTEIAPLVAKIIYHAVNQGKGAALRTGIAAALIFLEYNGVPSRVDDGTLYDAMIGIAERRLSKPQLAAVLEAFLQR
jgi:glycosyltransferase involved in cell wall biosynthesis